MAEKLEWRNERRKLKDLVPATYNPRRLTEKGYNDLRASLEKFNLAETIAINQNNTVISGHQRIHVLADMHGTDYEIDVRVPNRLLDLEEEKELNIRANKNIAGEWDFEVLANNFEETKLIEYGFEESELGFSMGKYDDETKAKLSDKFIIPPFSLWDTRQGYWQDRKRMWKGRFGSSKDGRSDDLLGAGMKELAIKSNRNKSGEGLTGTSEFDPVVTEICYRWFIPNEGGKILDPFAGGVVRGYVAGDLGYEYTGIDLSKRQVEVNEARLKPEMKVKYIVGNSLDVDTLVPEKDFDFVFSCPPYYDLEIYSKDPTDLSNKDSYEKFLSEYSEIIKRSVAKLKDNRFAVFVVTNIRDDKGGYRNFVNDTITAFKDAGCCFYNDVILANALGTAPMRATTTFNALRKVVKVHQNVLIFYKGDIKKIGEFPKIDFTNIEDIVSPSEIEEEPESPDAIDS